MIKKEGVLSMKKRSIKAALCIGLLFSMLCGNLISLADDVVPEDRSAVNLIENTANFSQEYQSGPYYEALKKVNLTGDYRTNIVEIAASQLGYCGGNAEGEWDGTYDGGKYTEYGRFLGSDGSAWCSEFASWCARMAGVPTYILNSSRCASVQDFGAPYYSWKQSIFGGGDYTPQPGDLILWATIGTSQTERCLAHTSIFCDVIQDGDTFIFNSIDGNADGEVLECHNVVDMDGIRTYKGRELAYFIAPNYESTGTEVTLNKASLEMKVGEWFQLQVSNGSDTKLNVAWKSSAPEIAEVNDWGWVEAVKEGQAVITAETDDVICACLVTVLGTEKPKELLLDYTSYEMSTKETLVLNANAIGFDSVPEIIWTSSDNEIAVVDKNGKVKPLKKGNVVITARAGDAQAVCKITVVEAEDNPDNLSLNHTSYELTVGETVQLKVSTPSNAGRKKENEIEWSSSDDKVASVDEKGLVTGVKEGSARIKAAIGDSAVACRIVVKADVHNKDNWKNLTLSHSSYELKSGNTLQLQAKATVGNSIIDVPANELEWSSSNTSVATVDSKGNIKAVSRGNAIVSAKVNDLTAVCIITVTSSSSGGSGSSGGGGSHGGGGGGGGGGRSSGGSTSGGPGSSLPSYVVKGEWSMLNGFWHFSDASGNACINNWVAAYNPYAVSGQQNYDWFRFDQFGNMLTGWFTDADGSRYYLNPLSDGTLGKMLTGWVWIPDETGVQRCYYLNPNSDGYRGKMLTNTVVDGYTIDANGWWTVDGVVQIK